MTNYSAITAVIENYLDGLYRCDTELLGHVFHPKAIYATADEIPMLYRTMDKYLPVVAARVSPSSRNEPQNGVIDSIEFAGENTAFARVRCSMAGKEYVDLLTFVQTENTWRIIAKVFQMTDQISVKAA